MCLSATFITMITAQGGAMAGRWRGRRAKAVVNVSLVLAGEHQTHIDLADRRRERTSLVARVGCGVCVTGEAAVLGALSGGRGLGAGAQAQGAVEQARVAQAAAQLALQARDRVQVLRGPGVL